jgi:polysaccharide biosynthesis protein PslG
VAPASRPIILLIRPNVNTRLLTILLGCLGLLAAAAPAQARVPRDFVGMTSGDVFVGDDGYRARTLAQEAAVGVGLIRQTFDWESIERTSGRYDLSYYDRYVADAARQGIRILPVLYNPPRFYARRVGRSVCPPGSTRPLARFVRTLMRRYGRRGSLWRERPDVRKLPIRSWQIWNEPNLALYWCDRPNPRAYARLLRGAYKAIKRVDRRAEVVAAGMPDSRLSNAMRLHRYVKRLYRAGGRRWFDTLAINSYARNRRELGQLLRSVRRLMNRRRDRRARIWVTEIGWGDRGPAHRFIVGPEGQAARIRSAVRYLSRNRRRLRLRGFVYYTWRDDRPYPPLYNDMWGLHTGLLTVDGARKPAFQAFSDAVARLR